MKHFMTVLIAALISSAVVAQQKVEKEIDMVKLSKSDVPGPLVQKVQKDFPNVTPFQFYSVGETTLSKDWKVTEEIDIKPGDKMDYYKVDMRGKGSEFEALYDAEGKLIMSRQVQKNVALPKPVMDAIASGKYSGQKLAKDKHFKMMNHGNQKEYYVVTLADGKKLTYAPDGTLLKE